jgi:hypothetical protein
MAKSKVRYNEGQWFLVPLLDEGYALGIIVRGNYKTRGGLGYFFGPRYSNIPDESVTWNPKPSEALIVTWFGDLGIIRGEWPLLLSTRPFRREDWPIPMFRRIDALDPDRRYRIVYDQEDNGTGTTYRKERAQAEDVKDLLDDGLYGYGAVQIVLTKLLKQ